MQHDPNTGQTSGAPEPAAPPMTYQQPWGQYAPPPPQSEMPPGQPGAVPSMPLPPTQPYAPPSQPYSGYPGYPGYGWPANATRPSPYGYPGYPGYQAPAAPARRRGLPVWAIVLISVAVVLVVAGGVLGAAAVLLRAEAGRLSTLVSSPPQPVPTATPTLAANERNFTDSLNGATETGWLTNANCFFKDGAYHMTPAPSYAGYVCFAPAGVFSDFDMRVSAQEISGPLNYGYGLVFRAQDPRDGYVFTVAGNGEAWFGKFVDGTFTRLSPFWPLTNFTEGLNPTSTLRVKAQGSSFVFYVNDTQVGTASDTTYDASARVGLYVGNTQLEAAFTNFSVTGVD